MSPRWIPSAVLFALVISVPVGDGSQIGDLATAWFFAFLIAGLSLPSQFGDVDSDGHRELMVAGVGGPRRLFLGRVTAAIAVGVALVLFTALLSVATTPSELGLQGGLVVAATNLSGLLVGASFGSFFQRPFFFTRPLALLLSIGAFVGVIQISPLQSALKAVSGPAPTVPWGLLGVAIGCFAIATGCAYALAGRSGLRGPAS